MTAEANWWSILIGMDLQTAIDTVENYDHKLRVTHYNDSPVPVFADFKGNRIDVQVARVNGSDPWRVTKLGGIN